MTAAFAPVVRRRGYALGTSYPRRIAVGALIGLLALGAASQAERTHQVPPGSKAGIAVLTARKLAYVAFPAWAAAHPDRTCPDNLLELTPYMVSRDVKDPYGTPYWWSCRMTSRGPHMVVGSAGEDAVRGTRDDASSDHIQLPSAWSLR